MSDAEAANRSAIRAVAALGEEVRRSLYEFARATRRPVTRDEAAEAVGISRKLAAFHLDKLVEAGLLRFWFRSGGVARVGRPAKVYAPSEADIQVSIPARRHELLADILSQGVLAEHEHGSARAAAAQAAYERGYEAGAGVREHARPGRLGPERALTLSAAALAEHGFEPHRSDGCVRLRNCPFHPLAGAMPELVCGLNHAFVRGVVDGLEATTVSAVLAPSAGECCVELRGQA